MAGCDVIAQLVETLLHVDVHLHSTKNSACIERRLPFDMQGLMTCCAAACAPVVKCLQAYAKVAVGLCNETGRIDIRSIDDSWC